jgi:hypothetical protein
MGKVSGKFVIILNITRVLSVDEITELVRHPGPNLDENELH